MSVHSMKVAAVAAAVLGLATVGFAEEADQTNPDSRALLEYVKKLEARVNQLEQEKQWPLDQVRAQSGSALESAVRSVNISGYMEFQYGFNLRHGGESTTRGDTLAYNALAGSSNDDNGFSFQNLQLLVDKPLTTMNSTGFRVRAQYGDVSIFDNRDAAFNAGDNAFDVREAFFSWRTNCPLGLMGQVDLSVGKFDTPIGIESPDNTNNWLVTRSTMSNLALPVTHTGLRMHMPWAECQKTTLYVVNGWDNVRDAGDGKTLIVSHQMGNFDFLNSTLTLNGSYGNEGGGFYAGPATGPVGPLPGPIFGLGATAPDGNKVKLLEAIWKGELDENNQVALDGVWKTADKGAVDAAGDAEQADTHGVSGYFRHMMSKSTWLAARAGWFATTTAGGSDLRIYDISVAMGWNLTDDLTLALEYRHDHSSTATPYEGKSGGSFMSSSDRVTASMVYSF